MRQTVSFPVSARPIEEGKELQFLNEELLKILPQLRSFANQLGWEIKTVTTTGTGAFTDLWVSPAMPSSATWLVLAWTTGVEPTPVFLQERIGRLICAVFASDAFTAPQALGTTTVIHNAASVGTLTSQFAIDTASRTVKLQVRDRGFGAAESVKWTGVIVTCEAQQT